MYTKVEHGKIKRPVRSKVYDPRLEEHRCTTKNELECFISNLKQLPLTSAFLHVLPDPTISHSPLPESLNSLLPLIPKACIERVKHKLRNSIHPPNITFISQLIEELITQLTRNSKEIAAIERATVGQSVRKRWHEERYGRLTASNFGKIYKAKKYDSLTTYLLSSGTKLSSRAIQWGKEHENEARQAYESSLSAEFSLKECGIYIHPTTGFTGWGGL